jgi:hypothetical protein
MKRQNIMITCNKDIIEVSSGLPIKYYYENKSNIKLTNVKIFHKIENDTGRLVYRVIDILKENMVKNNYVDSQYFDALLEYNNGVFNLIEFNYQYKIDINKKYFVCIQDRILNEKFISGLCVIG